MASDPIFPHADLSKLFAEPVKINIPEFKPIKFDMPKLNTTFDPQSLQPLLKSFFDDVNAEASSDDKEPEDSPEPATEPHLTAGEAVEWMVSEVRVKGVLEQKRAAWYIRKRFGKHLVLRNRNRNLAVSLEVLALFLHATAEDVVWVRKTKQWRLRETNDPPGREV